MLSSSLFLLGPATQTTITLSSSRVLVRKQLPSSCTCSAGWSQQRKFSRRWGGPGGPWKGGVAISGWWLTRASWWNLNASDASNVAQAKPNGTTGPSMGRVDSSSSLKRGFWRHLLEPGRKAEGSATAPAGLVDEDGAAPLFPEWYWYQCPCCSRACCLCPLKAF